MANVVQCMVGNNHCLIGLKGCMKCPRNDLTINIMKNNNNPSYDYTGKVALVTGASMGLGFAAAKAFAVAGASVMLSDINEVTLKEATGKLLAEGYKVSGFVCDVSVEAQAAVLVDQTVTTFGGLDMAFNNAGVGGPTGDITEESFEDFDRVNAVNLRGVWTCMKHELRYMRTQQSGAIVNCSSLGGLVGGALRGAYHAAKHGVVGLTKSVAIDYAAKGIRVNAVCPGVFDTPMLQQLTARSPETIPLFEKAQPIGRVGIADELAAAVLWLCSPGASFVIGAALPVDGGYTAQ